eukprot:scaffold93689_cov18-Tisochrysis_lutea.AAC.1
MPALKNTFHTIQATLSANLKQAAAPAATCLSSTYNYCVCHAFMFWPFRLGNPQQWCNNNHASKTFLWGAGIFGGLRNKALEFQRERSAVLAAQQKEHGEEEEGKSSSSYNSARARGAAVSTVQQKGQKKQGLKKAVTLKATISVVRERKQWRKWWTGGGAVQARKTVGLMERRGKGSATKAWAGMCLNRECQGVLRCMVLVGWSSEHRWASCAHLKQQFFQNDLMGCSCNEVRSRLAHQAFSCKLAIFPKADCPGGNGPTHIVWVAVVHGKSKVRHYDKGLVQGRMHEGVFAPPSLKDSGLKVGDEAQIGQAAVWLPACREGGLRDVVEVMAPTYTMGLHDHDTSTRWTTSDVMCYLDGF